VIAGGGHDTITAYSGDDVIDAGDGNNYVYAGYGNNAVTVGKDNNYIYAYAGNDTVTAGKGNNYVDVGYGNNQVTTGNGNDTVIAYSGDDDINVGGGDNFVYAGWGNNKVTAEGGNDRIEAYGGDDTIQAGEGKNYIHAGAGKNAVTSGSGNDTVYAFEGDDTINAGGGNNYIEAGHGNNEVTTLDGHDTIIAGVGNDLIKAGAGNNYIITGEGNDTVRTGGGNDTIFGGCVGDSDIEAGDGQNYVSLGGGNNVLVTGNGSDTIIGGGNLGNHNLITTGGGNDYLCLGAADDTVMLGSGNSTLLAGDGDDRAVLVYSENLATRNELWGGCGTDTLVLRATLTEMQAGTALAADIARYQQHLAAGKAEVVFQFNAIDLKVHSWEKFEIEVVNEPPVMPKDPVVIEGKEDKLEEIQNQLLTGVNDVNHDPLKVVAVTGAAHGTVTVLPDGTVTYKGDPDWSGTDTVTYTVSDGQGGFANGTAIIHITGVADAPALELSRSGLDVKLDAHLTDLDGSETLSSLTLGGLPSTLWLDPTLASYDAAHDLWIIDPAKLAADKGELKLLTAMGGEIKELVATATSQEADGDTATSVFRLFGANDNVVTLAGLPDAHVTIDAGGGIDSLVFTGGAELDLTALATRSLRNFEKVDLGQDAGANTLTLSGDKVLDMTDANHELRVTGGANDRLHLTDAWTSASSVTENSVTYQVYEYENILTNQTARLYVEDTMTIF